MSRPLENRFSIETLEVYRDDVRAMREPFTIKEFAAKIRKCKTTASRVLQLLEKNRIVWRRRGRGRGEDMFYFTWRDLAFCAGSRAELLAFEFGTTPFRWKDACRVLGSKRECHLNDFVARGYCERVGWGLYRVARDYALCAYESMKPEDITLKSQLFGEELERYREVRALKVKRYGIIRTNDED